MAQSFWTGWRDNRRRWRVVSRWRRLIGVVAALAIVGTIAGYRHVTAEPRLRYYAEQWLEDLTGGDVVIESARFDLFNGLYLVNVSVSLPESVGFVSNEGSVDGRVVCRADTLFLRLQAVSIISGKLAVPEIVAVDPELRLVRRLSDGMGNWEVLLNERRRHRKWDPSVRLPTIWLRNARLSQTYLGPDGLSRGDSQVIYATAKPASDRVSTYDVSLVKVVDAGDSGLSGESGQLRVDLATMTVTGDLPTMTVAELLFAAPPEIRHWLDVLDLQGSVQVEAFSFAPEGRGRATLHLSDAGFSVPIDARELVLQPEQRYVRFAHTQGTIRFDARQAEIELAGVFQNSDVAVSGRLEMSDQGDITIDDVGFELEFRATNVPLPRQDESSRVSEMRFVQRWDRLSHFVEDYDGRGNVDLAVKLRKEVGEHEVVQLVLATMTVQGASARYFRFPYRLYELEGDVVLRPDGWIEIRNLTGIHGSTRAVINGEVGAYVSKAAKLEITATHVEFDEDLLHCLAPHDQELCQRFAARPQMDLHVVLEREDYAPEEIPKEWNTVIDATFTGGSVCFDGFPYPLERLSGHMRIADGKMAIDQICGWRSETQVCLSGSVDRSDMGKPVIDLALKASHVPFDSVLERALPESMRGRYQGLDPAGRFDTAGRIQTASSGGGLVYDLTALLRDVELAVPGTSARLSNLSADIEISPHVAKVRTLTADFGPSSIEMEGELALVDDRAGMSFHVASPKLLLGRRLREALPEAVRRVYDSFSPRGTVAFDLQYDRAGSAVGPADSQPSGHRQAGSEDYRLIVRPENCALTCTRFPLPLGEVTGTITVTPEGVDLEHLNARHEQAVIELPVGRIDLADGHTSANWKLRATGLRLDGALGEALAGKWQRVWKGVSPGGSLDLSLDLLRFDIAHGALTDMEFDGEARLRGVTLDAGVRATDLRGRIVAHGRIGEEVSVDGRLDDVSARINGRLITKVQGRIVRLTDKPAIRLEDLTGMFYGGQLAGHAGLDWAARRPKYELSLFMKDVSLQDFLNARPDQKGETIELRGRVDGRLDLSGRFDQPESKRGSGSVLVSEAQLFKIPFALSILQVIHFALDDDNAINDATFVFSVKGEELILDKIDLRGKALSMVGGGRVRLPTRAMHLVLLVGSPLKLPRVAVLSDLLEIVARELMEVHVEGTLEKPTFRADIVRGVRKTLETILQITTMDENPDG